MRFKKVTTILLLVFVAGNLVWLATAHMRAPENRTVASPFDGAYSAQSVSLSAGQSKPTPSPDKPEVIAYYFHGNLRCTTCKTMEAFAHEAITQSFAEELASGRIQWKLVNVDEPANRHYTDDFNLVTRSLVLVRMRNGKVSEYQNLEEIWSLASEKPAFLEYVIENTRTMLERRS